MCNAVIPHMKARKYGRIINISSTAGQRGEAYHSPYAASKGGVIAFTKSIAAELIKHGIWVNCVAPGWVDTEMISDAVQNPKNKREIEETIPRGTLSAPEEIAGPILFLASHFANNIVGEVINVNGGSVFCG
jgi:3-oxoacyl-[acyl-carrier protein] reductase